MEKECDNIEQVAKALNVLPQILEAAFQHNAKRLESLSIAAIRNLREAFPDVAKQMSAVLVCHQAGIDPVRLAQIDPPPVDRDSSAPLLTVELVKEAKQPIFAQSTTQHLERVIRERLDAEKLLSEGVMPPRTILLKGPPGTGKTILARWLAAQVHLKLVTLDLATAISSYLGKTGMNLRRVLDYARATPCLLLLDEFDSIAKKRDDSTDVGELKRIVNVLLKELEDWPAQSILVAATNHPELLDQAIARRFDRIINTELPTSSERALILNQSLGRFAKKIKPELLVAIGAVLEGKSGANIETVAGAAVRRHIVDSETIERALLAELKTAIGGQSAEATGHLLRTIKQTTNGNFTVRELASTFDLSASTVHYHLKKGASKHA
jgi:SpoVK/Ycf46/Vps4 family AAA+-type ATPase